MWKERVKDRLGEIGNMDESGGVDEDEVGVQMGVLDVDGMQAEPDDKKRSRRKSRRKERAAAATGVPTMQDIDPSPKPRSPRSPFPKSRKERDHQFSDWPQNAEGKEFAAVFTEAP